MLSWTAECSVHDAGRISYLWGFTGPCMAIDTACSSGLVAIGTANHGMLLGLVPRALAGGVNLLLSAHTHAMFAVAGTQQFGHCLHQAQTTSRCCTVCS